MGEFGCEYEVDSGSRYVDPEPPELCGAETQEDESFCDDHYGYVES